VAKFSAHDVYSLISPHQLTVEQAAAIEGASITDPSLVIAGAGSGKTELMMVRVLFLVANGFARPEQILGLTFTRKAARELAGRVQQGLFVLRESPLWPHDLDQDFLPPKIATYNSFGNEIFRSVALELGYETEALLLSEASAISLASSLLEDSAEIGKDFSLHLQTVAERIITLSGQLTDNMVEPQDLADYLNSLASALSQAPKAKEGDAGRFAYTEKYLESLQTGAKIAELVERYRQLKFQRNYLDFADQVALSVRALQSTRIDHDYRFVLLDEYQDTSPIQTRLLSGLFAKMPVMAVGDPNQSIYAWRGASSANLSEFFDDFGAGQIFTLSTSWRSGSKILEVANFVSGQIEQSSVQAVELVPGRDFEGRVEAEIFQDQESEASAVCEWIGQRTNQDSSAAILFRTKESMRLYSEELRRMGVTHEVTGLSALLEQPEVVDLVSILRVLVNPEATVEIMRLMTGPGFQLSSADVARLHRLAQQQSRYRSEVERDRPLTLVEIVDEITSPRLAEKAGMSTRSTAAVTRLAKMLDQLRSQLSLSVVEIAWLAVREFGLDIELYAHSDAANPLANLQAFMSRIAEYENLSDRPTVAGFASWLHLAEQRESFELPSSGVKKGVVQLMSVHAAKGLEWDFVAIPNMNQGAFPTAVKEPLSWLSGGKLPPQLRLDANQLPKPNISFESQRAFNASLEDYKGEQDKQQLIEERRLAYVAMTRAAKELFLSASYCRRSALRAREVSVFLSELIDANLVSLRGSVSPEAGERPDFEPIEASWPVDPLPQRDAWQAAARLVGESTPSKLEQTEELALLLREREAPNFLAAPALPLRLSASAIVALMSDPQAFAQDLLRPTPQPYSQAADRGTRFHAGLEDAFRSGSELEISAWSEEEKELAANFADSKYAGRTPVLVEQSIEFALAGTVVVCKLDAVFLDDDHYQIVDWKSGKSPAPKDLASRAIQLALYRVGLCRLLGVGPERVSASFFFAGDGKEVTPELLSESELAKQLQSLRTARPH